MLLIFGSSISETIINVISFVCGYCHTEAPQNVVKRQNRFSVFFIPLFTFSTKYLNQCTNCGGVTELTPDQAQHSLAWAQSRG